MKIVLKLALFASLLILGIGTLPAASSESALRDGLDGMVGLSTGFAPPKASEPNVLSSANPLKVLDCQLDLASQQWSGNADDHSRHTASWLGVGPYGERCLTSLFIEGHVILAPDLAGIQSISPGGYFELSESFGTHFRKFVARGSVSGTVDVQWTADGSAKFGASGEEHPQYAAFLLPLERCLAFSATTRLPQLMESGGLQAVLDEIDRLQTDYARHLYLKLLVSNRHLDESQVRQVIVAIGKSSLCRQRGSTLNVLATEYPLADDQTWNAFLTSVDTVTSIREKQNALHAFLKNQDLSSQKSTAGLAAIAAIPDDNWKTWVLSDLDSKRITTTTPRAYFAAIDSIRSDEGRAYVLQQLITSATRGELPAEEVRLILQSAAKLEADAPRGATLERLASSRRLDDALILDYLAAMGNIESDSLRSRSLTWVLQKSIPGRSAVKSFVLAAEKIHSSSEQAHVLSELLRRSLVTGMDLDLIFEAAARMDSDIDRANILDSLVRTGLVRDETVPAYLGVVRAMKSAADRSQVLQTLLRQIRLNMSSVVEVLDLASSLHSDYELSRVLRDVATSYRLQDTARVAYMKAARLLKSADERERAMAAIK